MNHQSSIYLDHAAATPLWPATRRALARVALMWGNPGSPHGHGRAMRALFDASLGAIARLMEVRRDELVLTAGATESANLALWGVAAAYREETGRWPHIITTELDHPAVLAAIAAAGAEVTYVPVDARGHVLLPALKAALTPNTGLVSVIAASNELGTVQPLRAIATLLAKHRSATTGRRPVLHTDAAQLAAWQAFTARELGADLITFSAAKLGGPVSAGLLYIRRGTSVTPLLHGGGQQAGRRPGTEDVFAAVGLATALDETWRHLPRIASRIRRLRERLVTALAGAFTEAEFHGDPDGLPSFVTFSLPGLDADAAVATLDAYGVAVSTGAACSRNTDSFAGRALRAIGQPHAVGQTVRITLGHRTTKTEIDRAIPLIIAAIRRTLSHQATTTALTTAGRRLAGRYAT